VSDEKLWDESPTSRYHLNKMIGLMMRGVTWNGFPIKICDWFLACFTYEV